MPGSTDPSRSASIGAQLRGCLGVAPHILEQVGIPAERVTEIDLRLTDLQRDHETCGRVCGEFFPARLQPRLSSFDQSAPPTDPTARFEVTVVASIPPDVQPTIEALRTVPPFLAAATPAADRTAQSAVEVDPQATTFLERPLGLSFAEKIPGRVAIIGIFACAALGPGTSGPTRSVLLICAAVCSALLGISFGYWLVKEESGKAKLIAVIPSILVFLTSFATAVCLWVASSLIRGGI